MKQIIISRKTKVVISAVAFVTVFSLGAYARPGVDVASELASSIFTSKQTYAMPPSEYETEVNELWHSTKHQSVCKSNAAAVVALKLARKYLDEGEKQSALSNYDLPVTEAIEKTSQYGKR